MEISWMDLTNEEKARIESEAETLLRKHPFFATDGFTVDIKEIAHKNGFEVSSFYEDRDQEHKVRGCLIKIKSKDNSISKISVRDDLTECDSRFVIAHELGHSIMHGKGRNIQIALLPDEQNKPLEDQEADYFAACLLMPKGAVKDAVSEFLGKDNTKSGNNKNYIKELAFFLARRFKVSGTCAARKLTDLYLY